MYSARQHIRSQAIVSPLASGVLARCDKVEYLYTVAELWVVGGSGMFSHDVLDMFNGTRPLLHEVIPSPQTYKNSLFYSPRDIMSDE